MAIPTQFSVTRQITQGDSVADDFSVTATRSSPIANPSAPKDAPVLIEAESASIIDGANIFSSLAASDLGVPRVSTARPVNIPSSPKVSSAEDSATINAPVESSAQDAVVTPPPTLITAATGVLKTPPFPLNHARILVDNQLQDFSSITLSKGTNGGNTVIPNTYQRWNFLSDGDEAILYTMSVVKTADTVCIGSHNLVGATVSLLIDDDTLPGGLVSIGSKVITSNKAIMFHFQTPFDYGRMQINIANVTGNKFIGYISAGIALQMQRPFFNGHTPITDADVTEYYSNRSESGEIIGQQIRRQGYKTSADWQYIDDAWYREYFEPFKQKIKTTPFFFAWNLLEYPDDVGFCRVAQDISAPMQNGTVTKRSISMNLLGAG